MKEVYLIGAGGHARAVIALVEQNGFFIKGIYENNFLDGERVNDYPILGKPEIVPSDAPAVIAIGDLKQRNRLINLLKGQLLEENLFHPSAIIGKHVQIGKSNQVLGNVFINENAAIGDNNIFNTACVIEHEVVVGNNNHIAVGAVVCGRVKVSNNCFIGANSVIIEKVHICDDVIVGAGAVVVENITEAGTYVGNPARKLVK